MKKALILFGSPHKDGKTAKLLKYYLNGLENFEIRQINMFDLKFEFCRDCGICKKNSDCIYNDLNFLEEIYREADLLIIASPIHNLVLSAPLKALQDRTQKYYYARFFRNIKPYFNKSKKAFLILTGDSESFEGVSYIKRQLEQTFSVINASFLGSLIDIGGRKFFNNTEIHL